MTDDGSGASDINRDTVCSSVSTRPVDRDVILLPDGGSEADDAYSALDIAPGAVLHAVDDPVFALNEAGEFVFVNERLCELADADPSSVLGRHFAEITVNRDVDRALDAFGTLTDDGSTTVTYEKRVELGDDVVPVEAQLSELRTDDATVYVGILRDRTDREAANNRFEMLFESLPDPAVIADLSSGEPIVRRINGSFESVFGYSSDDAVGRSVNDLLVPREESAEARAIDDKVADGESVTREVRRQTAGGEVREFIFRNVSVATPTDESRVYGIYTDVTEQKEYERNLTALHETSRELMAADSVEEVAETGLAAAREILGHEINGLHLYDEDDGALVPVSLTDEARDLFGTPPALTEGSIAWRAYESGEMIVNEDVRDDEDVANPDTDVRSEMAIPLGRHGVLLPAATEPDRFDETDRSLGGVLAAAIEAALEQVARERELRESERALKRQNERLDEFASIVSHDLRNPLSIADGHLALALEDYDDERLDRVAEAHERMSSLVDDVLTWAREGESVDRTETVDVEALARQSWDAVAATSATLDVTTDLTVAADRNRLQRVLENLLRNSVEHGSTSPRSQAHEDSVEHGSTSNRPAADDAGEHEGDQTTVRVGDLDDRRGFYVADDGPGIDPSDRDVIFESGYSEEPTGTGFGLAIVEQIVEAHGWEITVTESDLGGARFEIVCGQSDG